jgi:hypothetical protein
VHLNLVLQFFAFSASPAHGIILLLKPNNIFNIFTFNLGRSIDEAAANWTRRAYRILNISDKEFNFQISKPMLQRRKIQYGEVAGSNGAPVPVYVLDFSGVEVSVVASPATRKFSIYDPSQYEEGEFEEGESEQPVSVVPFDLEFDETQVKLNDSIDSAVVPGFLLDWVVCATPLARISVRSGAGAVSPVGEAPLASECEKLMPLL